MDSKEALQLLEDLETRIERLKSLYQQYFMGIEKIPPHVLRKDVERTIWRLRRQRLQSTRLRFKFQQIIQRYNTYQQYWARILRDIERGTFKRDVVRAARRFGEDEAMAEVGHAARAALRRELLDDAPEPSVPTWELTADDEFGAILPVPPAGSAEPPLRAPAPSNTWEIDDEDVLPEPMAARVAPRATPPPTYEVSRAASLSETSSPIATATPSPRPVPPSPPPPPPPRRLPGASPSTPLARAPLASPRPTPAALGPRVGALRRPPPPPPRATNGRQGPGRPAPAAPRVAARPVDPASRVSASSAEPAPPVAAPPTARKPTSSVERAPRATETSPAPFETPASAVQPAPVRPPPPSPPARGAPEPSPGAAVPRRPQPAKPPAQPARRPGDRAREIYDEYVRARRASGERVDNLSYEAVRRSLQQQTERLRQKHGDRRVEYEVVTKNGRALIRPVIK